MTDNAPRRLVRARVLQGVGLAALDAPPVNALSAAVRRALWDQIATFQANDDVAVILILAEGPMFSAGADVREFGHPGTAPSLAALCDRIEASTKPVAAVLQGPALGGGAEIALAAHHRLAVPAATIALPEIALGLLPGAGGTQRLPRLAGVEDAVRMMLTGQPMTAEAAQAAGLIDGIVQGDAASGGHAFALTLAGQPPRPTRARRDRLHDATDAMTALALAREGLGPRALLASHRILDCVEAALLLPFDAALRFEAEAFADCLADPDSCGLRHVFTAERRIARDLLVRTAVGRREVTQRGRAVIERLHAAQDRAIGWLVARGVTEAGVDAAFLDWGFAAGPFGARDATGADASVRPRIVAALIAEGGRLIGDGTVARAGDIDTLAVHGMGFPRRTGGPMHAAQAAGLPGVLRRMRDWVQDDRVWATSPVLVRAGQVAGGFDAP